MTTSYAQSIILNGKDPHHIFSKAIFEINQSHILGERIQLLRLSKGY